MLLHYTEGNGVTIAVEIGKIPMTIGRNTDADLVLQDDKISRIHCRIFYEAGLHYIEDLDSKNGTYVNDHAVKSSLLKSGDRLKVGGHMIFVEDTLRPGTRTVLQAVQEEMDKGKGFRTIMREVVNEAEPDDS